MTVSLPDGQCPLCGAPARIGVLCEDSICAGYQKVGIPSDDARRALAVKFDSGARGRATADVVGRWLGDWLPVAYQFSDEDGAVFLARRRVHPRKLELTPDAWALRVIPRRLWDDGVGEAHAALARGEGAAPPVRAHVVELGAATEVGDLVLVAHPWLSDATPLLAVLPASGSWFDAEPQRALQVAGQLLEIVAESHARGVAIGELRLGRILLTADEPLVLPVAPIGYALPAARGGRRAAEIDPAPEATEPSRGADAFRTDVYDLCAILRRLLGNAVPALTPLLDAGQQERPLLRPADASALRAKVSTLLAHAVATVPPSALLLPPRPAEPAFGALETPAVVTPRAEVVAPRLAAAPAPVDAPSLGGEAAGGRSEPSPPSARAPDAQVDASSPPIPWWERDHERPRVAAAPPRRPPASTAPPASSPATPEARPEQGAAAAAATPERAAAPVEAPLADPAPLSAPIAASLAAPVAEPVAAPPVAEPLAPAPPPSAVDEPAAPPLAVPAAQPTRMDAGSPVMIEAAVRSAVVHEAPPVAAAEQAATPAAEPSAAPAPSAATVAPTTAPAPSAPRGERAPPPPSWPDRPAEPRAPSWRWWLIPLAAAVMGWIVGGWPKPALRTPGVITRVEGTHVEVSIESAGGEGTVLGELSVETAKGTERLPFTAPLDPKGTRVVTEMDAPGPVLSTRVTLEVSK